MKKATRRRSGLDRWIKDTTTPVFGISRQRRLVFFNEGCEQLTGWMAEQVLGQVCNYSSDEPAGTPQALADCLCPPPEVFAGNPVDLPIYVIHQNGQTIARTVRFMPLSDQADSTLFVIGILQAIVEPRSTALMSATHRLHAELAALRLNVRQQFQLSHFVGISEASRRVHQQIESAQLLELPVHLHGPGGSGKEFVARTIHYGSGQKAGSFVPLDCSRLTAIEIRQSLRDAFDPDTTQPAAMIPGALYLAHVDRLPLDVQQLLVELMEQHRNLRIYSSAEELTLEDAVGDGDFLAPLHYRLTPLTISIRSLRERREDVPLLAQHFVEQNNKGEDKQVEGFADDLWDAFAEYNWPGNVRELKQVVDECWQACEDETIENEHLPFRFRTGLDAQGVPPRRGSEMYDLEQVLREFERERIEAALEECRHNKSAAAQMLQLTRTKLYRRMQSLGIDDRESKS